MELIKLLELRKILTEEDKKSFDKAYDTIKELFLNQITLGCEALRDSDIDKSSNFKDGFKAAKDINSIASRYNVKMNIPESNDYLFIMYLLKFGTDVLKYKKEENENYLIS